MVVSALSSIKGITNICWYSVCIVVACKLSVAFFLLPHLKNLLMILVRFFCVFTGDESADIRNDSKVYY